ncbi:MAG: hypothetical protein KAQ92_01490, partial [Candidatus Aenigmarchaeota archaeon]|nr:hypothetical protein [Candidatus Aenigmarchaeota archaeon]
LDWNSSWINNDNTGSSTANTDYLVYVSGNPDMNLSKYSINVTDNIGTTNTTSISVDNIGNEKLGESSNPSNSIFVDYINQTMPSSWIQFYSTAAQWNDANDYWDYLNTEYGYTLQVNITADNYTAGTYTGIINITSYRLGSIQTYKEINVSITISPGLALSQDSINHTEYIGTSNITNISVQSTGNSPVTNITINYILGTLPAEWIDFASIEAGWNDTLNSFNSITEYTSKILSVNITALDYTPGTYTGKINLTTNENLYRTINVSTTITPAINTTINSINITQNISHAQSICPKIQSTGNAPLTNITIVLTNSTIPSGWLTINSTAPEWNQSTSSFTRITEETNRTLNITIKATSYIQGTYTGILNITSYENQNTQINLSITINPNATTYNLQRNNEHGEIIELYHIINSTGNTPLLNANATYIESTLPASWITLKYESQNG